MGYGNEVVQITFPDGTPIAGVVDLRINTDDAIEALSNLREAFSNLKPPISLGNEVSFECELDKNKMALKLFYSEKYMKYYNKLKHAKSKRLKKKYIKILKCA